MEKKKILVVESDPDTVASIDQQVRDLGCTLEATGDPETGLALALRGGWALVVAAQDEPRSGARETGAETEAPEIDGLELCRRLRERHAALPILLLIPAEGGKTAALGLESGADDYLEKPFNALELRARVHALLRRASAVEAQLSHGERIVFKDLEVNDSAREVRLRGELLDLTPTEYDLLRLFVSAPGKVFSREELLRRIWDNDLPNYEYNVTTHVSRLRGKLGAVPAYADCIRTVRGVGYRFAREDEFDIP